MTGVLMKRGENPGSHTEDRGKDWSHTAISQGVLGATDAGRGNEAPFPRVFRGTHPILINSQPPDYEKISFHYVKPL